MVGRIKGSVILTHLESVRHRLGPAETDRLLSLMAPEVRREIASMHASSMVDERLNLELNRIIFEQHGMPMVAELAGGAQRELMKRTHAFFLRLAGPKNLVRIAASSWRLFRDTGSAEAKMLGELSGELVVRGHVPMREPYYREAYLHAALAAISATNVSEPRGRHVLEDNGDARFTFEWRPREKAR